MASSEGLLGRRGRVGAPGRGPADNPRTIFPPHTQGNTIESEHLSELTEEEYEAHYIRRQDLKGFVWLDAKYLNPFFTRRLTQEVGHWRTPHGEGSPALLPQDLQGPTAGGQGGPGPLPWLGLLLPRLAAGYAGELSICWFPSLPFLVLV